MKKNYLLAVVLTLAGVTLKAQTPIAVGAGSYASFPPPAKLHPELQSFIYTKPIYVAENKKKQAIPTNDWWTDLVTNGKNAGALWAAPLVVDPEPTGFKVFFPNKLLAAGTGLNMDYGGSMMISGEGYTPDKALAKDWTDWGLVMAMPDSVHNKNMEVTMAHGVPFVWIETRAVNPAFSFDRGASFTDADGQALTFPITQSFVAQSDGRYFGIHLDGKSTAEIQGQQSVLMDLQTVQKISKIKLHWENAYAAGYTLQVSIDSLNWINVFSETSGNGDLDDIALATSGRYVRLLLGAKGTNFGYSIYEMEVYNQDLIVSQHKPVVATSVEGGFVALQLNDNNFGTRWASDANQKERLVLNTGGRDAYLVVSALPLPKDLTEYETYAFNKVTDTKFDYTYNVAGGKVGVNWNVTTSNLKGLANGNTLQGFLPHLYANAANNIAFTPHSYVYNHGTIKTAVGNSFAFTYDFEGILPHYTAPFSNKADKNPYQASVLFNLISNFSKKNDVGGDTYWDGKNLVNLAKYALMARETNHQAYDAIKAKTRARLVDWLTYTPGENNHYYAHYPRWGGYIGFDYSYTSEFFTDNHFHGGYLIQACALYGMIDPEFLVTYKDMIKLLAKEYANWDRKDTTLPYFRTLDPWIGHSYAGGTSSGSGNNQESSSEAMQSWIGLFQLGDMLGDAEILKAGAFGYTTESYATLEYWFDWKKRNFPADYQYNMVAIVSNQGSGHQTFFGGQAIFVHGIEYLPVIPGFKYLTRDTTWAKHEYSDLMKEAAAAQGIKSERFFGTDWANVALGFRQLYDPQYVSAYIDENMKLPVSDSTYIMKDVTAGITYYYTHANQNLGNFSFKYRTDFPSSSVFEKEGKFSHAVAYNPTGSDKKCTIYDASGQVYASFTVPARALITYPALDTAGQQPEGCYGITPVHASASSGNPEAAIDGNPGSRWESKFEDPQFLTLDLGVQTKINKISISWETANAKTYNLLASTDSLSWDTVAVKNNMPIGPRTDFIDSIGKTYRYIKVDGRARNTPYGYSIYEVDVCGSAANIKSDSTGRAVTLPAFIEAENYTQMEGVQVESTNDAAGGKNIGWIDTGDWMDYRVISPAAGTYQVKVRLASNAATGRVEVLADKQSLTSLAIPNTGDWQKWTTVKTELDLPKGVQTLRIKAVAAPFNLNWIDIRKKDTGFSSHIEAEDFVQQSGIQTEPSNDVEGGLNVSYIDEGDWMDYLVTIPKAGDYQVKYRVSSPYAGTKLQLKAEDVVKATTTIPQTNNYQVFTDVTTLVHFNTAGSQTIRLQAVTNGFNINWLEIAADAVTLNQKSAAVAGRLQNNFTPASTDSLKVDAVNVLSPNGDGINDVWVIKNIDQYPNNSVKIFDRSGKLVYTKKGYDNTWDGNYNGAALAEDTYYYIFFFGKGTGQKKGFITIVRQK